MDGVVSAFFGADRPGRPWVGWGRCERVVRSLAIRRADWVDGREVDHIEAHRRRSLEPLMGAVERAGDPPLVFLVPPGTLGAREELIPGGEQGRAAVDEDREILGWRYQLPWAIPAHRCAYVVCQYDLQPVLDLLPGVEALGGTAKQCGTLHVPGCLGIVGGLGEERLAFSAHERNIDAGWDLDLRGVHPGFPWID